MEPNLIPKSESTSNGQYHEVLQRILPFVAAGFGVHIAGRIINSEKFERLKSALLDSRKLQGDIWGAASQHSDEQEYQALMNVPLILTVPIQLRCKIWSFLNPEELRTLRLVCGRLQSDVDIMVGIHVILDSSSPCYQWVHHIAVQSCFVKTMDFPPNWDIIAKPHLLKRMEISKDFSINSSVLKSITAEFEYLEELTFHMKPTLTEEKGDEFSAKNVKSFLLSLETDKLDGLTIEFLVEDRSLKWIAYYKKTSTPKKTKMKTDATFNQQLSHILLNFSSISPAHRNFWMKILNSQTKLKTVNINLGDVNWVDYKHLVETNAKSLQKVFLSQIGSRMDDSKDPSSESEQPFDFAIFKDCQHLQVLGVSCESIFSANHYNGYCLPTNAINLDKVPHEDLQGLLLTFLNLTEADSELINSVEWGPKIKRGLLLHCSVEKSCMPTLVLKKHKSEIVTNYQGQQLLFGDKYDPCYHEPEITACFSFIEISSKILSEASTVLQEWATPTVLFLWVALC